MPIGQIKDLFRSISPDLFLLVPAFKESREQGLDARTVNTLRAFWQRPECRSVAEQLNLGTHDTWDAILHCCNQLSTPRNHGDRPAFHRAWWGGTAFSGESNSSGQDDRSAFESYEPWIAVAEASETLAESDPLAASIIALYALAAWEGLSGEQLYQDLCEGHDFGWYVFPLSLARNLLAADATRSAYELVNAASQVIETCMDLIRMPMAQQALAAYRELAAHIEKREADYLGDLAWELHASCGPQQPTARAEVAALLWTLGDVPHATLMGPTGLTDYIPSRSLVRDLVEQSYRLMARDPFVQYIWRHLLDHAPFDLRKHGVIVNWITETWHYTPVHQLDDTAEPVISKVYATAAIAHFAGTLNTGQVEDLTKAFAVFGQYLALNAPLFCLRLAALANLLRDLGESMRAYQCMVHAVFAGRILERTNALGGWESFDRRLDIPFYYLDSGALERLAQTITAVEKYRCAGLWFWLRVTPPERVGVPQAIAEQEDELLRLFRGAHFVCQPNLPVYYRRCWWPPPRNIDLNTPDSPLLAMLESEQGRQKLMELNAQYNIQCQEQLQANRAREDLLDLERQFESLWKGLNKVAPRYAEQRKDPHITIDEFITALQPRKKSR